MIQKILPEVMHQGMVISPFPVDVLPYFILESFWYQESSPLVWYSMSATPMLVTSSVVMVTVRAAAPLAILLP